jgi:Flp pilus assembly pilin Flp
MLPGRTIALTPRAAGGLRNADTRADARSGQGIVEYGLILSLMVVVAAVILVVFGGTLAEVLSVIGSAIDTPG